ncbi:MAG: hypothetical protein NZ772_05630 [Cyanobacteria bacterium]|nr:hypothetical protein [Cyanobacteriota bacterium]MDW8201526.1 hypothetical protein [Cyanobacteriota bacterium SKYGB_h_bin112]
MSSVPPNKSPDVSAVDDHEFDYMQDVIGAATFDLNGLPKDYYLTEESSHINWVQTIFQALGLRSLLMSSLQLEGFQHAVVNGSDYSAIVVKQPARYVALLMRHTESTTITPAFIHWVQEFDPSRLCSDERFRVT